MLHPDHDPAALTDRLRDAPTADAPLVREVIANAGRRFQWFGQCARTVRIERLIQACAWADAALALIDLELPSWQVRRIAYDGGEWHCALSRERELPDWLDQSVEARHADLALAMLLALIEVQTAGAPSSRSSVPAVIANVQPACAPLCCDNFA